MFSLCEKRNVHKLLAHSLLPFGAAKVQSHQCSFRICDFSGEKMFLIKIFSSHLCLTLAFSFADLVK